MPSEKKLIGHIDVTPSWSALLPAYLLVYETGPADKRADALMELSRMAMLADKYVQQQKNGVGE